MILILTNDDLFINLLWIVAISNFQRMAKIKESEIFQDRVAKFKGTKVRLYRLPYNLVILEMIKWGTYCVNIFYYWRSNLSTVTCRVPKMIRCIYEINIGEICDSLCIKNANINRFSQLLSISLHWIEKHVPD